LDGLKSLYLNNAVLLSLALGVTACVRDAERTQAEARTARDIIRCLDIYALSHRDSRPTNLFQVFAGVNYDYPYSLHERFSRFGERKGFSNSFYEKYVFPPPGVTNRFMGVFGEVLLLNAEPYPDQQRVLQREVICLTSNGHALVTLTEDLVEKVFSEAGQQIPKPLVMPAPPPAPPEGDYKEPFSHKRYKFFYGLAQALGVGGQNWFLVQNAALALIAIVLFSGLFWWSRRPRGRCGD
jgi:hypothetical protein